MRQQHWFGVWVLVAAVATGICLYASAQEPTFEDIYDGVPLTAAEGQAFDEEMIAAQNTKRRKFAEYGEIIRYLEAEKQTLVLSESNIAKVDSAIAIIVQMRGASVRLEAAKVDAVTPRRTKQRALDAQAESLEATALQAQQAADADPENDALDETAETAETAAEAARADTEKFRAVE